jgi:hypothetical protein
MHDAPPSYPAPLGVATAPATQPRHVRDSARHQARLNAETHAKLQKLVAACDRKPSAVLRLVRQWGLTQTQGWTIDRSLPATVQPVAMPVEPELLQQVQEAASAQGASYRAIAEQLTAAGVPTVRGGH